MTKAAEDNGKGEVRRPLKIAILGSRGIPHSYSGYEAFIGEVGPRLVERGHEVTVYCRKSLFQERPKTYKGVRLVGIGIRGLGGDCRRGVRRASRQTSHREA